MTTTGRSGQSPAFDVVVAGGGLSGLAAAVELSGRGARVGLFDQSPRLGGRCFSFTDPRSGDVVDNGQHILLGAYRNVLRYLGVIGTAHMLAKHPGMRLPFFHPEKGFAEFRMPAIPRPFHLPAAALKFRLLTLGARRKMLRVGYALSNWDAGTEARLATLSIAQWLDELGQSEQARSCFWHPIAVSAMNASPEEACALPFARSLRAVLLGRKSDGAVLIPSAGQSELYVGRAVEFLERHGADVRVNCRVETIELSAGKVAGVRLRGGRSVRTSSVIAAVPHHALASLLPEHHRSAEPFSGLKRIGSSPIVSINLWFDREFMEPDYLGLIDMHLQWVFNRRKITASGPKSGGYLSAVISGADDVVDSPREKLVAMALRDLHVVFPACRKARLTSAFVVKEKRATFRPTCDAERLRPPARTPIENFFLAGDWTATGLPGTIEGAVQSGYTAAGLVK